MRLTVICAALDRDDQVLPHLPSWVGALAEQVEGLDVLALRVGEHDLDGIQVTAFGRSSRPRTAAAFLRAARRSLSAGTDAFLVIQGGPYPLLLWPWRRMRGVGVYQWKAHPHVSPTMRLSARHALDGVFTATARSFPYSRARVLVVGHGIDTSMFAPQHVEQSGRLVAVGRIAPAKRLEHMVAALAELHRRGRGCDLDLVGPVLPSDVAYRRQVEQLARRLGVAGHVHFRGPVAHERLPRLLSGYAVMLNDARTALDKSAAEAMACGVPVVTCNPRVAEVIPESLSDDLVVGVAGEAAHADRIERVLDWTPARREEAASDLRDVIVSNHGLSRLMRLIAETIRADREQRQRT